MTLTICKECQKEVSSNADKCPHCGNPLEQQLQPANKKHSRLGITSFVLSIVSFILLFLTIIIGYAIEFSASEPMRDTSPVALMLFSCVLFFTAIAIVALGLGIASFFQKNQKRLFSILGTVFASMTIIVLIIIILVSFLSDFTL